MKKAMLAVVFLALAGCASTSGPFVTNISNNGKGELIVEKCMSKYDPWLSAVHTSDCQNYTIKTGNPQ